MTYNGEAYWSTYAIKEWLNEWLKQNPMEAWTIDNYDGRDSYEELNFKFNRRHEREPPLAPNMFHHMRATMEAIEIEMDEVLDPEIEMPEEKRKMEWNKLKKVSLSVCDDYLPGQSKWGLPDDQLVAKGYRRPRRPWSRSNSAEDANHESEDQDEPAVRNDHVMAHPRAAEARQSTRQPREHPRLKPSHTPRDGSCSAEEGRHESGDQDDPVDCNDHVRTTPRTADVEQRVWRDHGQAYSVKKWSMGERMEKEDLPGQLACFLKGQTRTRQGGARDRDEDESEEEVEQMVCNMIGQEWEKLPFPMIIDSGACASVMPTSWCNHIPIRERK